MSSDSPAGQPPLSPRHWPMWLVMGVMCLGARLPWALQRWLGGLIGRALLRLVPDRREAARTNLALCLP